jgi:hypothetical protein
MSGNSQKYTQRWENKPEEKKQKSNTYEPNHKKNNYDNPYTSRQKNNYDNQYNPQQYKNSYSRQDDKSYNQQKAKPVKQAQTRSIYKYKIEQDKSGNCSYVLEEPVHNPIKQINNYEIKCVYPINMTNYYKNVNIYNYKKKIII